LGTFYVLSMIFKYIEIFKFVRVAQFFFPNKNP